MVATMTKVASTNSDGIIQIDDADNHLSCFDFQKKMHEGRSTFKVSHVRFGSKADICSAKRHVCFTPASGHASVSAYAFVGSSRLKCPRRCSHASKSKLGSPASMQITKNHTQPADSAMKPAPDER